MNQFNNWGGYLEASDNLRALVDACIRFRNGDGYNSGEIDEAVDRLLGYTRAISIVEYDETLQALKRNAKRHGATDEEIAKVLPE